ncbi:MAG: hypothetical protein CL908_11705 [Deltaproteobacteria bacterium]|nr:hypothetical protein [Deltaproteobacteria bacterium]
MHRLALILVWTGLAMIPCTAQASDDDLRARQQRTIDEVEIAKLPVTYAWAVDAKDIDLLMTLFSEDAVYDLSAYGFPSANGKKEVREVFLSGILTNVRCSLISISNIRVEISGDTATGGDYFIHAGYDPQNRPKNIRSHTEGQHFYEFKKESGTWKISRMRGSPSFEKWETYAPESLRRCLSSD